MNHHGCEPLCEQFFDGRVIDWRDDNRRVVAEGRELMNTFGGIFGGVDQPVGWEIDTACANLKDLKIVGCQNFVSGHPSDARGAFWLRIWPGALLPPF